MPEFRPALAIQARGVFLFFGTGRNNIGKRGDEPINITPEWFDAHVKNNPNLTYTVQGGNPGDAQKTVKQAAAGGKAPGPKKNKYWARKVFVYESGMTAETGKLEGQGKVVEIFDSEKEYTRWQELKLLAAAGQIAELKRQVPLVIQEAFEYEGSRVLPIVYVADFMYIQDGQTVVEDVKGFDKKAEKYRETEAFRLKWKLLKAKYPNLHFVLY